MWPASAWDTDFPLPRGSLRMGALLAVPRRSKVDALPLTVRRGSCAHAFKIIGLYVADHGGDGRDDYLGGTWPRMYAPTSADHDLNVIKSRLRWVSEWSSVQVAPYRHLAALITFLDRKFAPLNLGNEIFGIKSNNRQHRNEIKKDSKIIIRLVLLPLGNP